MQQVRLLEKSDLPPVIGNPFGIAAGMDGNLFVVDLTDDDIYLIPSTKANETTGSDGRIIVTSPGFRYNPPIQSAERIDKSLWFSVQV